MAALQSTLEIEKLMIRDMPILLCQIIISKSLVVFPRATRTAFVTKKIYIFIVSNKSHGRMRIGRKMKPDAKFSLKQYQKMCIKRGMHGNVSSV